MAKEPHGGGYGVMVGERGNIRLSVYFHVTDEFIIVVSHGNALDSLIMVRAVEGT